MADCYAISDDLHTYSSADKQHGSNDLYTYPSADDVTSNTKADCYALSDHLHTYSSADETSSDSNAISRSQLCECDQ